MGPIASVEDKRRLATVKCGLSVPSSSGKSLEPRVAFYILGKGRSFSPLFIGEVSGTGDPNVLADTVNYLSVPSSSGKSLERHDGRHCHHARAAFSPLFIGEVSGTERRERWHLTAGAFQSPLHRGSLWNSIFPKRNFPFSRLSVPSSSGKSLERFEFGSFQVRPAVFQSPLHRGSLWNFRTAPGQ